MLPEKNTEGPSIYIVEDLEILRTGISLALSNKSSFNVVGTAGDGLTAYHQIKELRPDIVLMDISLPVMSGIEVTEKLKRECPEVKIIMLSGHEDSANLYAAIMAGASGYCLKDSPGEKLQLAIRSVMTGAIWVDHRVSLLLLECVDEQSKKLLQAKTSLLDSNALSSREKEVLHYLGEGFRNKEIANALKISISTVRSHISNMTEKLEVSSRTQLALKAQKVGLM